MHDVRVTQEPRLECVTYNITSGMISTKASKGLWARLTLMRITNSQLVAGSEREDRVCLFVILFILGEPFNSHCGLLY